MDDVKRIANNLRILRKYKGDTREELAEKLNGYSSNTIASYELGRRNAPMDYIEDVAKLYGVSVNMIREQTLTRALLDSYNSSIDIAEFFEMYEFYFLAVATSEFAKENQHFKKADEYRKRIENMDFMEMMVNTTRNLYYKSFAEDGILAGAANTIMMLLMEYSQVDGFSLNLSSKSRIENLTNGDVYIQARNLFSDLTPKRKAFIQSTQEIYDKCIKALGDVDHARIYAEYYTALKYFFGMVDNERDYRENLEFGLVMLKEFSLIGNPFAKKAIEFLDLD